MLDSFGGVRLAFQCAREAALLWFVVGLGVGQVGLLLAKGLGGRHWVFWLRRCAVACGVFAVGTYVVLNLDSLRCFLIQQDEANILSISAATVRGLPMYHPPVSPDFSYSLMYGPVNFLIYAAALMAGGVDRFWILRASLVLAALGICVTLGVVVRRYVSLGSTVALLTFPVSVLLQRADISLSLRSDLWIVLFTSLAIASSLLPAGEIVAIVLTGVFGGLVVGLKITAATALLFPLYVLYRRFGLRAAGCCVAVVIGVFFAPFLIPNVSLRGYVDWILFTRTEGLSALSMTYNVFFATFLVSPLLMMEWTLLRYGRAFRSRMPEFGIIVFCLLIGVFTSKNGSGVYYLWHIVPSVVVYMAMAAKDLAELPEEVGAAPIYRVVVACTLFACTYVPRAFAYVRQSLMPPGVAAARQSIDRYLDEYKGRSTVQMGYGSVDGDYRTLLRYVLVYRGQPYALEGNTARFETRLLPFPRNVLEQMSTCRSGVWLVPHGQPPFDLWVFPDALREVFLRNYRIEQSDGVFDVWGCKRAGSD